MTIGIVLTVLLINFVLLFFVVYGLASKKIFWSFTQANEVEYVLAGGSYRKLLANIPHFKLEEDKDFQLEFGGQKISLQKIVPGEDASKTFNNRKLGIFGVGIYPYYKILSYGFAWDKNLATEKDTSGTIEKVDVGNLIISHRSESVSSLYFRYTYPIIARGIDLADRFSVDIALNVLVQAVYPEIPVLILKGKWFVPFVSAVKGAISEYAKNLTYNDFRKQEKRGTSSHFGLAITSAKDQIIRSTGMMPVEVDYIDYKLTGAEKEKEEAIASEEIEKLKAKGVKAKAGGQAYEIIKLANAKAKGIILEGKAKADKLKNLLEESGKSPYGAQILNQQIITEGLGDYRGKVLSLGGKSDIGIMVDTNEEENEPEGGKP